MFYDNTFTGKCLPNFCKTKLVIFIRSRRVPVYFHSVKIYFRNSLSNLIRLNYQPDEGFSSLVISWINDSNLASQ